MVVAVTRPTRLNISQAAVIHNVQQVRESAQASFVFLAVKANAYGFGLVPMSQAALAGGVDGLAVAVLDEGLALRQAGITAPILVLGITLPQYAKLLADNQVMATVGSLAWLETAAEYLSPDGPRLQVNLAVDTGMGRIGFRERATFHKPVVHHNLTLQPVERRKSNYLLVDAWQSMPARPARPSCGYRDRKRASRLRLLRQTAIPSLR